MSTIEINVKFEPLISAAFCKHKLIFAFWDVKEGNIALCEKYYNTLFEANVGNIISFEIEASGRKINEDFGTKYFILVEKVAGKHFKKGNVIKILLEPCRLKNLENTESNEDN